MNDSVADVPSFTTFAKEPKKGIPKATSMLILSQVATHVKHTALLGSLPSLCAFEPAVGVHSD